VAKQTRYLLRSTSGVSSVLLGAPVYLVKITRRERSTHWSVNPAIGRHFTAAQREVFITGTYAHVTGRWVRADKAIAAFGVPPISKASDDACNNAVGKDRTNPGETT
jgi:hypothetical protein